MMGLPAACVAHGDANFWLPNLRKVRSLRGLDTLSGVWVSDVPDAFREGAPVPDYPGMIIQEVEEDQDGGESFLYRITGMGTLDGSFPDKRVGGRTKRGIENFDEASAEYLSWRGQEMACTGDADANIINCPDHRYRNNDILWLTAKTGGDGLTLKQDLHVINASRSGFKVAATSGGSALVLGTPMTDATIVLRTFARGSVHPKHPYLYLTDAVAADSACDWSAVQLAYKGLIGGKPKKRTISINGQSVSRDDMILATSIIEGGGWNSARKGTALWPKLMVEDIDIRRELPSWVDVPTSDVTNILRETSRSNITDDSIITDPPVYNPLYTRVSGPGLTQNWPCYWSLVSKEILDSVPGASIYLIKRTWELIWQLTG